MGFGDACAVFPFQLLGTREAVFLCVLAQIIPDIKAWRADDIHVDGESSGTAQMEHQGRAPFKDEGAAGNLQGFQQGEGTDGFLQKRCVSDVGILGAQ